MADNIGGLTDTYINDLIQKKIQSRNSMPQVQAGTAQSALATVGGNTDIGVIMSGLRSIGQGIGGADAREIDQYKMNAAAEQQNFTNQQAADDSLFNMLQKRDQGVRQNAATQALTAKNKLATENREIQEVTKRNTANAKLGLIEKIKGLRTVKDNLAKMTNYGVEQKFLTAGGAGQDFTLTDAGKDNTKFAETFRARANIEDETKKIQDLFDQDILKREADKDRYNNVAGLSAREISEVFLAPSTKSVKAAADINASEASALKAQIKKETGGSEYKNNVFGQSQFDLNENLDQPATDLLEQVSKGAADPTEVTRLFTEAQGIDTFAALDSTQQKFILAQFLKDKKGVGSTKNTLFDLDMGEWSSETLMDDLPTYVDKFNVAKQVGKNISEFKAASATKQALRNLNLSLSGG